jgi:hypothetical protein
MATLDKEVTKKQDTAPAVVSQLLQLEAEEEGYEDMSDYEIPLVKLMQGMSEAVKEGDASVGEYRNSVDNSLLAKRGEPLELLLVAKKSYINEFILPHGEKELRNKKYLGQLPYSAETANLPYKEPVNEGTLLRYKIVDWYVLLAKEGEEVFKELPYVLRFQVSQIKIANKLNFTLGGLKRQGVPRAAKVFELTSKVNPSDENKNLIYQVKVGRDATKYEMEAVAMWAMDLQKGAAKVVEAKSENEEII